MSRCYNEKTKRVPREPSRKQLEALIRSRGLDPNTRDYTGMDLIPLKGFIEAYKVMVEAA